MRYDLPGSGSSSLHGRASGVMECWYTKAARLPIIQKQNIPGQRISSINPFENTVDHWRELVHNVKNPSINF